MKVALMTTHLNDAMFPETGQAVVRLLSRLRVETATTTAGRQPIGSVGTSSVESFEIWRCGTPWHMATPNIPVRIRY